MSRWDGKSKGTALGHKLFLFTINFIGLRITYHILRLVSLYYFLFAKKNTLPLIAFYTKGMHFPITDAKRMTRENFFIFGQTLIDRAAFLLGKGDAFTYSFTNENYLLDLQKGGRGGILISAHLGNWETAGNLLKSRITSRINVVMLDAEAEKIKKVMDEGTGGSLFNIIAVKDDLSHVIKINNALENNELIAMHADRSIGQAKTIEMAFLGKKARFPYGPFLIASKFNAPVTFVFAVKEKKFHYALSATKPIIDKLQPEQIAKLFVEELEKKVKAHPEQWFNYYNFFEDEK